jgi:RND family efflux transporter MFP subunit
MTRGRILLVVAALAAVALALFVWRGQPPTIATAIVRTGPAAELVYATGFVEAEQPVSVASRITAPVVQVFVAEGDRVRRGQPLFVLDDDDQQGQLAQAAAQRRRAVLDETRTLELHRRGWVTRAARDEAVAAADSARAAERSAAARVDQLIVRAGVDGVVLNSDVEPGDLASPSRALMVLGDPGRIWITATIDERDMPLIRVGQAALMRADAWPGRVIRGHVRELTPGGDPNQRSFRARIGLDDAPALPMGLTLEVNVVIRSVARTTLVPLDALDDGALWVIADGRAHRRAVRTGISGVESVQVLAGVRPGELVAVQPAGLREGQRVRQRSAAAASR